MNGLDVLDANYESANITLKYFCSGILTGIERVNKRLLAEASPDSAQTSKCQLLMRNTAHCEPAPHPQSPHRQRLDQEEHLTINAKSFFDRCGARLCLSFAPRAAFFSLARRANRSRCDYWAGYSILVYPGLAPSWHFFERGRRVKKEGERRGGAGHIRSRTAAVWALQ